MKNQKITQIYSSKKTISCNGSESKSPHPKIYLNLLPSGKATCPYCGIEYVLQDNKKQKGD